MMQVHIHAYEVLGFVHWEARVMVTTDSGEQAWQLLAKGHYEDAQPPTHEDDVWVLGYEIEKAMQDLRPRHTLR